jgi:hypothetical protein
MKRLAATLALSIIGLGAVAAPPAQAQRRWVRAQDSDRRVELRERIRDISDQAARSYNNGRLSRDHYNRTLAKLDRSRNAINDSRLTREEFDREMRWLDEVEETLRDWRGSDRDNRVNGRRVRGRYMNDDGVIRNRHNQNHWMEQWRR